MKDKRGQELRKISRFQYGTLRFIAENNVTMAYLRHANGGTLKSILKWGWIAANGPGDDARIVLTKAGQEELDAYQRATLYERVTEADLTESCLRLLRYSRRLVTMPRRKAA